MKTLSISIQDQTYQSLRYLIGARQISKFVDQAITKELEKRRQELIKAYQSSAKSQKLKKELAIWEEALEDIK